MHLHGESEAAVLPWSTQTITIGGDREFGDDVLFFHLVEGASRIGPNRLAVASRGTNEIILVDSLGRRLGVIGRTGSGPGEFARLASILHVGGDTIAAFDAQLRRISILTSDGVVVRDFGIEAPAEASNHGLADAVGIVNASHVVLWIQARLNEEDIARLNRPNTVGRNG